MGTSAPLAAQNPKQPEIQQMVFYLQQIASCQRQSHKKAFDRRNY